jgi:hypothetical protein
VNEERTKASAGQSPESAADRSVHRLLTRALRADTVADAAGCLDAETVAAWMDGALAADLRTAAEGHAAGCARCQAVLSAMVRTAPPAAPRSWWPASLTIRWLVPAAAAVTAAALLILVSPTDDRSGTTAPLAESDSLARTQPSMAPPAATSTPSAAVQMGERGTSAGENRAEQKELAKSAVQPSERFEYRRDRAETGRVADESSGAQVKQEAVLAPSVSAPPPPPLAPPPAPAAPVRPGAALAGDAAARAAGPERLGQIASFKAGAFPSPVEIVSPDPMFRWRAGAAGVVGRSTDGGVTWTVQQTGATADFIAGSSPSRDICWLVGRGGIVLLSTDGTTWQQRPIPEAVDLVAVSAADAKTASVTTSDGRRFSTTDGGAKWF